MDHFLINLYFSIIGSENLYIDAVDLKIIVLYFINENQLEKYQILTAKNIQAYLLL